MISFFVILLSLLLVTSPSLAFKTGSGETTLQLRWGAMYDSNLLHYSTRDRDAFKSETELFKSPIRSLDDLRTDYKLSAEFRAKIWPKKITALRATLDFAHHLMDPIKNLGWISLSARQDISKWWIGSLGYFYEPRYYIRDYTDSHTGLREHCDFTLFQVKPELTYRPKWLYDVTGTLLYKAYRYNEFFTEYDGDLLGAGLEAVYRPKDWRFALGYSFENFKNSGFNSSQLIPEGSDLSDNEFGQADYNEDVISGSARYSYKWLNRKNNINAEFEVSNRVFTTSRDIVIDPFHSSREDFNTSYSISSQMEVNETTSFELGIGRSGRSSDSEYERVSQFKDYTRMTVWFEISYELK